MMMIVSRKGWDEFAEPNCEFAEPDHLLMMMMMMVEVAQGKEKGKHRQTKKLPAPLRIPPRPIFSQLTSIPPEIEQRAFGDTLMNGW